MDEQDKLTKRFKKLYEGDPVIARAPAVVSLLGDFSGMNEGYSLPIAVDCYAHAAINKREDDKISIYSVQAGEKIETTIKSFIASITFAPDQHHWSHPYIKLLNELINRNYSITGFNVLIDEGNNDGLDMTSASAGVFLFAVNELLELKISKLASVILLENASGNHPKKSGPSAHYASVFGKKDFALLLDCKKLWHEYIKLKIDGYRFVLFYSNWKNESADNVFRERKIECDKALQPLQPTIGPPKNWRDFTLPVVEQSITSADTKKLATHIIKENARVISACEDIRIGDAAGLGAKFYASFYSVQSEYGVNIPGHNYLVNVVKNKKGVTGSKIVYGTPNASTVNLVCEEYIETVWEELRDDYGKDTGRKLTARVLETADGCSIIQKPAIVKKQASDLVV